MEFTIETLEPQQVLGIRSHTNITEIGNRIGEFMPEVGACVGDRQAGPPLARYHTWENHAGEMEVAIPVREACAGEGRVEAAELPGGRAVIAVHVGPYEGLKEAWTAVGAWIKEQGLEPRAAPWESYVSDPTQTPAAELETRIVWPIQ